MVGGVDDTGLAPVSRYNTTMVSVWQIAPIEGNSKAIIFNLHSEKNRQRALDDMIYYKVPALTGILQLVQESDLSPRSILFSPVSNNFRKQLVVGSISIVFSWDDVLRKLLPSYINGIVCVIRKNILQSYTFLVNGDDVSAIGKGDPHDPLYDSMIYTVDGSMEGTEDGKLGVVENLITYQLDIYPSLAFETQYVTNAPAIYTTIVAMTFLATSRIFSTV